MEGKSICLTSLRQHSPRSTGDDEGEGESAPAHEHGICITNDLSELMLSLDFTINCTLYEPIEDTYIDVTGQALFDVVHRLIRISVPKPQWSPWLAAHLAKPWRYWKMRLMGYNPADVETHQFCVQSSVEVLLGPSEECAVRRASHAWKVIAGSVRHMPSVAGKFEETYKAEVQAEVVRQGSTLAKDAVAKTWALLVRGQAEFVKSEREGNSS
jgi:hypothetical protein